MRDRPTPETDRRIIKQSPRMCGCHYESEIVFASLARRLERERDEARDELSAERALADRLAESLTACERWVNQLCAVKDEANKTLAAWKEARQ